MSNNSASFERDTINNQKRIIRELKRIADALEHLAGTDHAMSPEEYVGKCAEEEKEG